METLHVDLKPNKSLIDYDFEKYQLSLDKLKVRNYKLDKGISEFVLSDKQYSFQHFTAFGINNHLYIDQWSKHHIYWINKNEQIEGLALKNAHDNNIKLQGKIYLTIPQSQKSAEERLNPGINFASHNYLFMTDGLGSIYLVYSGDRGEDNMKWKIILKEATLSRVEDENNDFNYSYNETNPQPGVILHSINRIDETTGRTILECLSLSVQEQIVQNHNNHNEGKFSHPPAHKKAHLLGTEPVGTTKIEDVALAHIKESEKHTTHFVTILQWDTFLGTDDGLNFVLDHRRILEGLSSPNYAAIEPGGQALHLLSDMPFKFVYDSKKTIKSMEATPDNNTKNGGKDETGNKHIDIDGTSSEAAGESEVAYYWSQTETDLTLKITLPDNTTKKDIKFHLEPTSIKIAIENNEEGSPKVVLEGLFRDGHKADVASSTWELVDEGKGMEITLCKNATAGHDNFAHSWPNPPLDSSHFPGQMDPEYYKSLLDKMDAFTSDGGDASYGLVRGEKLTTNQASSEDNRPLTQPYNMQELEDCDSYPQDTSLIARYCGKNHIISHQASLSSNKYLFTCTNGDASACPAFALRYDVHATIWQPVALNESQEWDDASLEILPNQPVTKTIENPWINVGALNAFGYVLASKESRKFIGTSPDPTFNYAAISDSSNHVFIYWHLEYDASKSLNKNVLRNRKSGKVVEKISKQQVVTLGLTDQENSTTANPAPVIMGMACLKDSITVLTNNALYIIFLH